ncbi:MAG: hypothetical protein G3M70_09585 [Candidatus Nitronauta litoralis]|uniref:Uncharacterized protein n=1 Tax=Candidatus Nitronauta litoralis TaxID=2705533 RepID=A0A7T0BWF1_9BACT|nr:MAG: hypothetical protein G3M70_09585 [Candidatus Nitronauta litoralis]
MSVHDKWEQRFFEWKKMVGFEKEPTPLEVFQMLLEKNEKNRDLLFKDLQAHFNQIDEILQETPSERPNE